MKMYIIFSFALLLPARNFLVNCYLDTKIGVFRMSVNVSMMSFSNNIIFININHKIKPTYCLMTGGFVTRHKRPAKTRRILNTEKRIQ